MKTASFTLQSVDITASSLMRILTELKSSEKMEISREPDGKLKFQLVMTKGDKREITPLVNRMEKHLNPEPVTPGWMGRLLEPSDEDRTRRREHRHEIKTKSTENIKASDILLAGLQLCLVFKDISDGVIIEKHMSKYIMFDIAGKLVYCKPDKTPVMYQVGENGELVYLNSQEKPKLGTYKMVAGKVVPV